MEINKPPPHDVILDHYTPECPICKGVLLPERVKELEDANDVLSAKLALAEGGTVEYQVDVAKTVPSVTYEDLQAEVADLKKALVSSQTKFDKWRDLYKQQADNRKPGLSIATGIRWMGSSHEI